MSTYSITCNGNTADETLCVVLYRDGLSVEFFRFGHAHRLNQWGVTDEQVLTECVRLFEEGK